MVDVARTQQRVDKVFAAVLLASVLGLALFGLINLISYVTLRRWHASEQVADQRELTNESPNHSCGAAGDRAAAPRASRNRRRSGWR